MNLLFDLTSCQSSKTTINHGGKEYSIDVFNALRKRGIPFSGIYNSLELIDEELLNYCRKTGKLYDIKVESLQDVIFNNNFDIFYSGLPYNYGKIDFRNTKFIGTIHGLRPIEMFSDRYEIKYSNSLVSFFKCIVKYVPLFRNYYFNLYKRKFDDIFNNNSLICITDSEHSKYSIQSFFPKFDIEKIKVFYCPLSLKEAECNVGLGKYYLLVSGDRWVKNTYRAAKALDELFSQHQIDGYAYIVGCSNPKIYKGLTNKDNFVVKGYVSNEELRELYRNAFCLIFLSLNEGWGYPPLEAISCDTPVICSPFSSLSEIYGNSVLYCNPYSIQEIKNRILQMNNSEIYEDFIRRGKEQYEKILKRQEKDLELMIDFICKQ